MNAITQTKCTWCGEGLNEEELADPRSDDSGDVICDECYSETFRWTCSWCHDYVDKSATGEWAIGSLFIVAEPVPACRPLIVNGRVPHWYDAENHEMRPGVYVIKEWPFYADGVVCFDFYARSFAWFSRLPPAIAEHGLYAGYKCGSVCPRCAWRIRSGKWRWPQWNNL